MTKLRERGIIPILSLCKGPPIPLGPIPHAPTSGSLYGGGSAVEREFGRLENE